MKWKVFASILIVMVAVFLFYKYYPQQHLETKSSTSTVKVIDGDTLELPSGKKVRLIGIDAPEEGKPLFYQSKNFLGKLFEGKEIVFERDKDNADHYGRLLRYAYADDQFVNLLMLKNGYASFYSFGVNTKHAKEFADAEKFAKAHKLGIWKSAKS